MARSLVSPRPDGTVVKMAVARPHVGDDSLREGVVTTKDDQIRKRNLPVEAGTISVNAALTHQWKRLTPSCSHTYS